jgi:hypothetical protein
MEGITIDLDGNTQYCKDVKYPQISHKFNTIPIIYPYRIFYGTGQTNAKIHLQENS